MTDVVVDANIPVKWVLDEPDSPQALELKENSAKGSFRIYLLDYGLVEATHVIWKRLHRKLLDRVEVDIAFMKLHQLPVIRVEGLPLLPAAFDLACRLKIAVYDALFVAAVEALNGRGVTADEKLMNALGTAYPQIVRLKDWK